MEIFESVVESELLRYLPFLLTTTVLMQAVKAGAGREAAHEAIKEHAVAVAKDLRTGRTARNDLLDRLAADARLGLDAAALADLLAQGRANAGDGPAQVDHFCARVDALLAAHPDAAAYLPGNIL
jgi:adenylosuccinate lyase